MKIVLVIGVVVMMLSSINAIKLNNKNHNNIIINDQQQQQYSTIFKEMLSSDYGGWNCMGCAVGLSMIEQMSIIHEKSIDEMFGEICTYFPNPIAEMCNYFVSTYGNEIISLFAQYQHADEVCHALQVCGGTCRLYNQTSNSTTTAAKSYNSVQSVFKPSLLSMHINQQESLKTSVSINPWQWLKQIFNLWKSNHVALEDLDLDKFSDVATFRGYNWRGRDCNDLDNTVYPGRISNESVANVDWNCNGILGSASNGTSYEDLLCKGTGQLGVVVAGDSAGAHFSIPPAYMTAALINKTTFLDLPTVIEDEADWPHRSAYTGWEPSTPGVPVDSLYLRLRERNLCNHRDYQNLAVNGGSSESILASVSEISRSQFTDQPVLLFIELIGNDVCSQHHNLDDMTTAPEFIANIEETLLHLDTVLPNGSHIVFVGLVDGRVLWDNLHNRTHPVGVTYEEMYSFLSCLSVNPCWGWLNPNETIRNETSERAALLSSLYPGIIANNTYSNFDVVYFDFPFNPVNDQWLAQGGETWQLIEPIDGFHPNQIFNSIMAEYFWDQLSNDHPDWFGQVNPNNQMIQQLFGDQGGY